MAITQSTVITASQAGQAVKLARMKPTSVNFTLPPLKKRGTRAVDIVVGDDEEDELEGNESEDSEGEKDGTSDLVTSNRTRVYTKYGKTTKKRPRKQQASMHASDDDDVPSDYRSNSDVEADDLDQAKLKSLDDTLPLPFVHLPLPLLPTASFPDLITRQRQMVGNATWEALECANYAYGSPEAGVLDFADGGGQPSVAEAWDFKESREITPKLCEWILDILERGIGASMSYRLISSPCTAFLLDMASTLGEKDTLHSRQRAALAYHLQQHLLSDEAHSTILHFGSSDDFRGSVVVPTSRMYTIDQGEIAEKLWLVMGAKEKVGTPIAGQEVEQGREETAVRDGLVSDTRDILALYIMATDHSVIGGHGTNAEHGLLTWECTHKIVLQQQLPLPQRIRSVPRDAPAGGDGTYEADVKRCVQGIAMIMHGERALAGYIHGDFIGIHPDLELSADDGTNLASAISLLLYIGAFSIGPVSDILAGAGQFDDGTDALEWLVDTLKETQDNCASTFGDGLGFHRLVRSKSQLQAFMSRTTSMPAASNLVKGQNIHTSSAYDVLSHAVLAYTKRWLFTRTSRRLCIVAFSVAAFEEDLMIPRTSLTDAVLLSTSSEDFIDFLGSECGIPVVDTVKDLEEEGAPDVSVAIASAVAFRAILDEIQGLEDDTDDAQAGKILQDFLLSHHTDVVIAFVVDNWEVVSLEDATYHTMLYVFSGLDGAYGGPAGDEAGFKVRLLFASPLTSMHGADERTNQVPLLINNNYRLTLTHKLWRWFEAGIKQARGENVDWEQWRAAHFSDGRQAMEIEGQLHAVGGGVMAVVAAQSIRSNMNSILDELARHRQLHPRQGKTPFEPFDVRPYQPYTVVGALLAAQIATGRQCEHSYKRIASRAKKLSRTGGVPLGLKMDKDETGAEMEFPEDVSGWLDFTEIAPEQVSKRTVVKGRTIGEVDVASYVSVDVGGTKEDGWNGLWAYEWFADGLPEEEMQPVAQVEDAAE